ncbi:hypothetical protein QOT17_019879 [Balamuthia mandrillaris]
MQTLQMLPPFIAGKGKKLHLLGTLPSFHPVAVLQNSHVKSSRWSEVGPNARPQLPQELYRFLKGLQNQIDELGNPTRTVAVDTVQFTHPEYILRTYAPQGSGQPSLWENRFDYKTILFEGLVMSGEVLPPVIFTNCPTVPKEVDVGGDGKVVYIPGLSAPSADQRCDGWTW